MQGQPHEFIRLRGQKRNEHRHAAHRVARIQVQTRTALHVEAFAAESALGCEAGESRDMPVYYFIQPDLPEHIRELTLSYTFFQDPSARVAQSAGERGESP